MKTHAVKIGAREWFWYRTRGGLVVGAGWAAAAPARRVSGPYDGLVAAHYRAGRADLAAVPVDLAGLGPFTQRVLVAARRLPPGTTIAYAGLARAVGQPGAARAVGNALGANPVPLFVPCHRVTARTGLGGFSSGLARKRRLLDAERRAATSVGAALSRLAGPPATGTGRMVMRPLQIDDGPVSAKDNH